MKACKVTVVEGSIHDDDSGGGDLGDRGELGAQGGELGGGELGIQGGEHGGRGGELTCGGQQLGS